MTDEWKPSEALAKHVTAITTKASEQATRAYRENVNSVAEKLAARGLGTSGPSVAAREDEGQKAVKRFGAQALTDLLQLLKDTYHGRIPSGAIPWLAKELKARVTSFSLSMERSLAEIRTRDGVGGPTRRLTERMNMARTETLRDIDIALAPFEIRAAEGIPDLEAGGMSSTTIYNLTGPNSRVNIASTDSSTNIVNVDAKQLFAGMRGAAEHVEDEAERGVVIAKIDALEKTEPKGFAAKYADFMGSAANHMTVFQPFLPALGQLLMGMIQSL